MRINSMNQVYLPTALAAVAVFLSATATAQVRPGPILVPSPGVIRPIIVNPTPRLLVAPRVRVENAATGTLAKMSFTWGINSANSSPVTAQILVNGKVVQPASSVAMTPAGNTWDSGPQSILLTSLATIGNLFVAGLNTVTVQATQGGLTSSASATFVSGEMWVSVVTPPIAEQPINLSWRLVEIIPQSSPDASSVAVSVSLGGQPIFPLGSAAAQYANCYQKYYPDSTTTANGWYADCGVVPLTIPALDPRSQAGASLDAVGAPVTFAITASVADLNAQNPFPLSVGPYTVSVTPVVAGLVPQFPVSYERKDYLDSGNAEWMDTSVSISSTGLISGTTITNNSIALAGFHGCVSVFLYDANGLTTSTPNSFWHSDPQRYGEDGTAFGGGQRTDTWSAQVTPAAMVNLIGGGAVYIAHYLCANNAITDFNNWIAPATSIANLYTSFYSGKSIGSAASNSKSTGS